ncbi:CPBP family intramembrane glutamic endopeptidase [Mariniblastus fucicola]|uniref:CAAX amino terminal protease self-immunity n=1 Tax=Mariniblastus fucicola TaxID=980251 RepID=A0A5B9PAX8_9BACT|nr:CPBP family intramembrane glutamic endopeptidase [Mariniblastus fucicola]QEG23444.1 CAAX amino terminal protease self- immunity [Mariniblastus fucicola]
MNKTVKSERTTLNLIAVLFAIALPTLVTLIYFKWLSDYDPSVQQSAYGIGKFVQFALPVVWVGIFFRYRFGKRKQQRTDPESEPKSSIPAWLWSVGFGASVCIVMVVALWVLSGTELLAGLTDRVQEKVSDLGIDSVWKYALLGLFYALVHSFLEEYYWRWFVFDLLKRFVNVPAANAISSLGFMAHHVVLLSDFFGWTSPMTWLCSAGVAIGGAYWAWLYQKTGTLMWSWVSHMVVDAGIFAVGYFLVAKLFG